jgi:hypothetical protein
MASLYNRNDAHRAAAALISSVAARNFDDSCAILGSLDLDDLQAIAVVLADWFTIALGGAQEARDCAEQLIRLATAREAAG